MFNLKLLHEQHAGSRDLGGWVLRCGIALFFILMGLEKLSSNPASPWWAMFRQIGLGQWFRYFTGVVEIIGSLLYLIPRTLRLGALLLGSAMIGAIVVHIVVRHSVGSAVLPTILLLGIVIIAMRESD